MGARNKEAHIVCIDVGEQMSMYKEHAAQAISGIAISQFLHKPSWFLSIVAFGSTKTNNPTYEEIVEQGIQDQYTNINVLKELSSPNMNHVKAAKSIADEEGAEGCSDFVEMLTVACAMFKTENLDSKIIKKIILISNFAAQIAEIQEEFITAIKQQLQELEIWLEIYCLDGDDMESNFKQSNLEVLDAIRGEMKHSSLTRIPNSVELLGAFKAKTVGPFSTYRGNLTISPSFQIPVRIYKKTSAESMPSLKAHFPGAESLVRNTEYFMEPPQDELDNSTLVGVDGITQNNGIVGEAIAHEDRVKAYQYGHEYVPLSAEMEKELQYAPEKGVTLLGFTDRENIPRNQFIKESSVLLPEAEESHMTALSGIVRAMHRKEKVAIIRVVARATGSVQMMVGIPYLQAGNYKRDCLVLNQIAFAEDIRNFTFTSFQDLEKYFPTKRQVQVMSNIIDKMDLDDKLDFEQISDPSIQWFQRFLAERALDENAQVPESDELIDHVFEQNLEQRFPGAKQELDNLPELFKVEKQTFIPRNTENAA